MAREKKIYKKMRAYCEYLLKGYTEREIAEKMGIVLSTVKMHSSRAKEYFGVKTSAQVAVAYYKTKMEAQEETKNMLEEYNYNEESDGRSETLIEAIDKIKVLNEALKVALDGLRFLSLTNGEALEVFNKVTEILKDDSAK